MSNKTNILSKIKYQYKNSNFESILKEIKVLDMDKIKSKEVLYMIALAHDQIALKKDKQIMRNMQKLAKKYAFVIIKKFPHWDKGYFVMGLVLQHSGEAKTALKFYEKAQQINPKNTSYYLSIGNGYRAIKNFKLAQFWYKKALKINSIRHLASVNLVSLYEEMEEKNLITKYAKKTLELLKNKNDLFSTNQGGRMEKILKLTR